MLMAWQAAGVQTRRPVIFAMKEALEVNLAMAVLFSGAAAVLLGLAESSFDKMIDELAAIAPHRVCGPSDPVTTGPKKSGSSVPSGLTPKAFRE